MESNALIGLAQGVTKKWKKQKQAEERNSRARGQRLRRLRRVRETTIKEAVELYLEQAYMQASADNTLPATARQILYALRPLIQSVTDKELDHKYFQSTLLIDYMHQNQVDWDVVFDARGSFSEPHTELVVPLGTLDVREYLLGLKNELSAWDVNIEPPRLFETKGPWNRYSALLFIEKEGFGPLFKKSKLAERYDIAIMSTKGMSVTASRQLADIVCGQSDIPLLVLHDFDKAGFSIVGTLKRDTDRYEFENEINVVDLGIRLSDVHNNDLDSEYVAIRGSGHQFRRNLRLNGATADEIDYLMQSRRVELNAFSSGDFVKWIEGKLDEHGIKKVVPSADDLEFAFRQTIKQFHLQRAVEDAQNGAQQLGKSAKIPRGLRKKVDSYLSEHRNEPWDNAIRQIVADWENK